MSTQKNKIGTVRKNLIKIGDTAKKKYDSTGDINVAKTAIKAFDSAIRTARVQILYKRLTGGTPNKIEFLEE
jgi:hypothetical protein